MGLSYSRDRDRRADLLHVLAVHVFGSGYGGQVVCLRRRLGNKQTNKQTRDRESLWGDITGGR